MATRYRVRVDVRKAYGDDFYFGRAFGSKARSAEAAARIAQTANTLNGLIDVGDDTYVRSSEIVAVWVEAVDSEED